MKWYALNIHKPRFSTIFFLINFTISMTISLSFAQWYTLQIALKRKIKSQFFIFFHTNKNVLVYMFLTSSCSQIDLKSFVSFLFILVYICLRFMLDYYILNRLFFFLFDRLCSYFICSRFYSVCFFLVSYGIS